MMGSSTGVDCSVGGWHSRPEEMTEVDAGKSSVGAKEEVSEVLNALSEKG